MDYDNAKHAYESLYSAKKPDHNKISKVSRSVNPYYLQSVPSDWVYEIRPLLWFVVYCDVMSGLDYRYRPDSYGCKQYFTHNLHVEYVNT